MFRRLYPLFQPNNYQLELNIDRENLTFTGIVTISGKLTEPANVITLHAKWLDVQQAEIDGIPAEYSHHEFDELRVATDSRLKAGDHTIRLEFTGKIQTDSMHGLYVSNFVHEGIQKQIIVTQFESHHAREVFPCVDEPEAKATFDLKVHTPLGEPVLSNTLPVKEETTAKKKITTFETTPVMSTYLLALCFGEMHSVVGKTKSGTLLRTWASVAQPKKLLEYSLKEGISVLEFYEKYFKTPFPLSKCDQIALPDFDAGAMENWGMVTYREIALLTDPDNRSVATEQYVSLVIAHELSHQWFGNLVTMKWWDDLWLNESFASIMEHLCLNELHPDWQQWEDYTAADAVVTSNRDVFSDVQAVRVSVDNPELIETLFDPAIVYAKGGRLIKMLREYIGDAAFRSGLQEYFKTHAYKNTSSDDLWHSLSKASGKDIGVLMHSWLEKSGMPQVSVTQKGSELKLSQSRFLLDEAKDSTIWNIPLLANKDIQPDTLSQIEATYQLSDNEYVFLNQHGSGHYVVNYTSDDHKKALAHAVAENILPNEGKITLLNDQLLLAKRGDTSLVDVLKLVRSNAHETRDNVWSLMISAYAVARNLVEDNKEPVLLLKTELAELMMPHHRRLGWDRLEIEDPNDTHLRISALSCVLAGENPEATQKALTLYDQNRDNLDALPADLRTSIMRTAVRHHKKHEDVIHSLLNAYQNSSSADLQLDICSALTQTRHSDDVKLFAEKAFGNGGFVRNQDFMRWIALLAGNNHTRDAIWDYFETNWNYVKQSLKSSKSYDYFPIYVSRGLNTEQWQKRYDAFFKDKLTEIMLERNIKVAKNDIETRVAWRKRDEEKIKDYISSK